MSARLLIRLAASLSISFFSSGVPAQLYLPAMGKDRALSAWLGMGYTALEMPALGSSYVVETELGTRIRVFAGSAFVLPSPTAVAGVDAYERNREAVKSELERGNWKSASDFWKSTQGKGKAWDYKRFGGLDNDDLGYVMSGYTGETLYPKWFHLAALGAWRNFDQFLSGKGDYYGWATYGIRLRSKIFSEMGYDYAASRQYINDFIDEGEMASSDSSTRLRALVRSSLRPSAHSQFLRRLMLEQQTLAHSKDVIEKIRAEEVRQEQIRHQRPSSSGYREPQRRAPTPSDWGSPQGRFGPGYNPSGPPSEGRTSCGGNCLRTNP